MKRSPPPRQSGPYYEECMRAAGLKVPGLAEMQERITRLRLALETVRLHQGGTWIGHLADDALDADDEADRGRLGR